MNAKDYIARTRAGRELAQFSVDMMRAATDIGDASVYHLSLILQRIVTELFAELERITIPTPDEKAEAK
ncbi:MAG: hypothetical protein QW356_03895 [Candidatus Hadarchaeales archaeon]